MHSEYDICFKCKNFEHSEQAQRKGWDGVCKRYNIKRMEGSESCDYLEPLGTDFLKEFIQLEKNPDGEQGDIEANNFE